jgi:predicted aspartyl protease
MTNGAFNRRALLALAGLPLASWVLAPRALAQAAPLRLPMQVIKGKVFVDVMVNGRPVQAMVDSGAGFTGLHEGLAAELGVEARGRRVSLRHVHGAGSGRMAEGVRLGVGGVTTSRPMLVTDFSLLTASVLHPILAVLGSDFLGQYVAHFDFDAGVLELIDPRAFAPPPGAEFVQLQRLAKGGMLAMAPILIEGAPAQALIDTGSQTPLIVSSSLARRLKLLTGRPVSTGPLGGFGGVTTARVASLKSLTLAGETFVDVPVRIAPANANLAKPNLGLEALARFNLWLDLAGLGLWVLPRKAPPPFERNLTGFMGMADGDDAIRVTFVARGGPAEAVGLKEGDVVARINGQPANTAQIALADAGPGTPLSLTLQDGRAMRLVLATYY